MPGQCAGGPRQPRVAVDDRQHRPRRCRARDSRPPRVQLAALSSPTSRSRGPRARRSPGRPTSRARAPVPPLADADLRIPAIHEQYWIRPPRDRACATSRNPRASRPTSRDTASFDSGPPRSSGARAPLIRRVLRPAQVHAQDRFVDARRCAAHSGGRSRCATRSSSRPPCTRARGIANVVGPQARRQCPLAGPMPIALARLADPRRLRGTQRGLELLFTISSIVSRIRCRIAISMRRRPELRNLFVVAWPSCYRAPSRHPPAPAAKRAQLFEQLRRMMTRFLLFHQTQDTTTRRPLRVY